VSDELVYRRRWWTLLVLCLSLMVITLDNTILNVAVPTLVRDMQASTSELQWIIDSYTLVFAGMLLTAGSLGDRFGRKGALQVGLVIFGLGSALSAFATTPGHLIATRALMGVGGAFIMPSTLSILTHVFPAEERGRAIGVWAGVSGLGIALGPLLGGLLVEHIGWEAVFWVNVPVVVLALISGAVLVPSSKDPSAPRLDPVGALLSIAGLSALVFGLIEAPAKGWTSTETLLAMGLGLVLLVVFAVWELRCDHPMLDVSFFRNPRFSAASAAVTLVFFAMFGFSFLSTQYFQFVLGFEPASAGVRMLPMALTLMVVAPLSSRIVERVGTKAVVATGLGLVAVSLALQSGLSVDSSYADVIWRMVLLAVGMGLTMAPATESIMGSLPLAKAGVGSAVNDTTRQVGGALGVAIIGSVLSTVYGDRVVEAFDGSLPPAALEAAQGSLGGALEVAERIGPAGDRLLDVARSGFVEAMHTGALVAAVAAAVGSLVALLFLPAHARRTDEELQRHEYEDELTEAEAHGAPVEHLPAP
jgi:EmrB/QacA subfamily drug resistance transporter